MEQGNSLEAVAKWLGHRNPTVTYQHYWTTPGGLVCNPLRPGQTTSPLVVAPETNAAHSQSGQSDQTPATADHEELYEALRAKVEECELLHRLLRQHQDV